MKVPGGFTVLLGDTRDDPWLVEALAAFAELFPGEWSIVQDGDADALLASSPDSPRLAAPGMPAVVRLPLGAAARPGTLGVWGDDPREAGRALALLALEPRLRVALTRELQGDGGDSGNDGAAANLWRVEGPFDSSYSLAIVNRELARALDASGVFAAVGGAAYRAGQVADANFLARHPGLRELYDRGAATSRAGVVLFNSYPPQVADLHGGLVTLANYAWEESGFPQQYVRDFNWRLDLITVVSPLVKKILRDNGVRVPMAVVGNGVDHLAGVAPQPMDISLGKGRSEGGCRFLHVSSCFPRKGLDVLLDAYGRAFSCDDAVTLIVKSFPNPHNDAGAQIAAMQAANPRYPAVVLIDEDLPEENVVWLYTQCDAFVLPSRAEGFGLPIAEAALNGLPVIVSAFGGHRVLSDEEDSFLIACRFAPARTHLGVFDSAWVEPDAQDLAEILRRVHLMTPIERSAFAERARQRLLSNLSWQQVAARTREAVAVVRSLPALPRQPTIAWISTWNSRCGIAAYSRYLTPAIEGRLKILANIDAKPLDKDSPNVVRCWRRGQVGADRLLSAVRLSRCGAAVLQWHPSFLGVPSLHALLHGLRDMGVRCYMTLHNTTDLAAMAPAEAVHAALAAATRLLVHSVDDLNRLQSIGLVDNVTLFPHGVITAAHPDAGLAQSLGLAGRRIVASFGYLRPHKGLSELIRAFALLAPRQPELHLLLVNALFPDPDSEEELAACETLIAELGLQERVTLMTDFLPEDHALSLLALSEVVVFPYQHTKESSSAAVRMGIGSGRPVMVTPLPIFDDVAAAVDVLPGITPEEIAAGLQSFLTALADPARRNAIEQRPALWREAHRWQDLSERLVNLIDGEDNDPFGYELL